MSCFIENITLEFAPSSFLLEEVAGKYLSNSLYCTVCVEIYIYDSYYLFATSVRSTQNCLLRTNQKVALWKLDILKKFGEFNRKRSD